MKTVLNLITYTLAAAAIALALGSLTSCNDADSRRFDTIPPYITQPRRP